MNEPKLQEFWEACGGGRDLRLLIEHRSQPARGVIISTPFGVIGSSDASEIFLADDQVSFRHAYLQYIAGQLWCFDLLSRTGTIWKQRRESVRLFDGSEPVGIGSYHLQNLARESAQPKISNPLLATAPEHDRLPTVTLEFPRLSAGAIGNEAPTWQLDRVLTFVGRSQMCKVRISCPSVSFIHCSMLRTDNGVWVVDLIGRGGIVVNGVPARWARLCDGDRLRVGRMEMRVHEETRRVKSSSVRKLSDRFSSPSTSPVNGASAADYNPLRGNESATAENKALTRAAPENGAGTLAWSNVAPNAGSVMVSSPLPNDAGQALLLNVVNQFSVMQQQMVDQFQQTTLMMLQMFSALHKDQFELIREELNAIRELNSEIQSLQFELSKQPAASPTPHRDSSASRSDTTPASQPAEATRLPTAASYAAEPPHVEPAATPAPVRDHSAAPSMASHSTNEPARHADAAATIPDKNVHAWLSQRFSELQNERQNRWQKIVSALMGK